ncbi:MAG TPA: 4Fe-4S dicluster domain-containing protein [Candidatus Xenobia bacterium]|nr:4Fe-4S dicluster domain-containing protein [Candidatus Xenobia bacterium]
MIDPQTQPATDSGARPVAGAGGKKVRGVVYINSLRCKGCGFCIAFCPPKVLAFSHELNRAGYHPPRLVNPDGCTGCDLCGLYCPDFAIYGVMLKPDKPAAAEMEQES